MVSRILRNVLPAPAKRLVKSLLGQDTGVDQAEILLSLRRALAEDINAHAPEVFNRSGKSSYGRALQEYLQAEGQDNKENLASFPARDFPVSSAFYADLERFYLECDRVEGNLSQAMKRLAYTLVPYYHCTPSTHTANIKNTLPLVGMLPTLLSNRRFVADAMNGIAYVNEILPDRLVSEYWGSRPHAYPLLRDIVAAATKNLSPQFLGIFSGRDQLIDSLVYQVQLEIALTNLMKERDWKLIIAGDAGMSLPLTLFDLPDGLRPPVAYFEHGLVYGDPYHSVLARADHFLVHGDRDRAVWEKLGVKRETMHPVGCLTVDNLPLPEYSEIIRQQARLKNGLKDGQKAILYGMDWQANLIDRPSTKETQRVVIDSLRRLKELHGQDIVLFLKYHPAPGDPFFYQSRVDYPLHEFFKLAESGIDVRLATDLESYFPLADCYLNHESTTIGDALCACIPTLSLDYNAMKGSPLLGHVAYEEGSCHRLGSLRDSPEKIAGLFNEVLTVERASIYPSCQKIFRHLYDFGRTAGLASMGRFLQEKILKS